MLDYVCGFSVRVETFPAGGSARMGPQLIMTDDTYYHITNLKIHWDYYYLQFLQSTESISTCQTQQRTTDLPPCRCLKASLRITSTVRRMASNSIFLRQGTHRSVTDLS
jgi:hypothetical protein